MRRRSRTLALAGVLLLALLGAGHAGDREDAPDRPGAEEALNREIWESVKGTPYAEALRHVVQARATAPARALREMALPNGWRIAPAGAQVRLGRLPFEAALFAGRLVVLNTGYYRGEGHEVSVVDVERGEVVKTLRVGSLFPSAAVGLDGALYLSGGFDRKVYRLDARFEVVREYPLGAYAAGLVPVDARRIAVASLVGDTPEQTYGEGALALLDTETGTVEREVRVGYFPYAVHRLADKLYVTLVGENKVAVYDARLEHLRTLSVGRSPQAMCSDAARLYVVNSASDDVTMIDSGSDRVVATIPLGRRGFRFGSSPTSCAVDGDRLYVSQAGINAVAVVDRPRHALLGLVPAGWYPAKVLLDRDRLFVVSAKGVEPRRPNPRGPQPAEGRGGPQYVLTLLRGALGIVPRADIGGRLAEWTRQVEAGSPLWSARDGFKVPIRHVFYVVKENRTYDQVLGDLGRGNGDPTLTLFGRDVTPNHHALAEQFVTLDNFFANGEISVLGHSFTTSGYATPFLEWLGNVGYARRYKGYPYGTVPAAFSPAYLWDALEAKNVDYRIYGEFYYIFTKPYQIIAETYGPDSEVARKYFAQTMALAARVDRGKAFTELVKPYDGLADTLEGAEELLRRPEFVEPLSRLFTGDDTLARLIEGDRRLRHRFARFLHHYPLGYHYYDLGYSDLDRARTWKADFDKQLDAGRVARLHYIWLPNDHTAGLNPRYPAPDQLVAQNDAALGLIVETIARSPVWKESLVLVVEDDAQDGPDHVDATRTIALAAGPWVRRGAVVSDAYDQVGLLRTIEMLLGLDPLNMNDGLAAPMFSIFADAPDAAAYVATPPSSRLMEADRARWDALERAVRGGDGGGVR